MRRRSPYSSPPPRRGHGSRKRSYSPKGGRGEASTSLLVRNISRDTRSDDLKAPFERYGAVKDVYLPKDYYSGEPRGFGFIQFIEPQDAIEAQYKMNHQVINGREISVVFAEESRKKPAEMRMKETTRGRSGQRRSPGRGRSRSRSPRYYSPSPRRRRYSRSYTPPDRRGYERFYPSPGRRESYFRGPSPGAYRRDQFPPHVRDNRGEVVPSFPPFVPPGGMGRFDVFPQNHAGVVPPYPPYHHGLSGNRGWDV